MFSSNVRKLNYSYALSKKYLYVFVIPGTFGALNQVLRNTEKTGPNGIPSVKSHYRSSQAGEHGTNLLCVKILSASGRQHSSYSGQFAERIDRVSTEHRP